MIKEFRISTLSVSLVMFVLGLILTIKPAMSVRLICYMIAGGLLILSVSRLIAFIKARRSGGPGAAANMTFTVVSVVVAVLIAMNPDALAGVIPVVLGVFIVIDGIILILSGITYREFLPRRGISSFIFGVILLVLGIYSIRHSFSVQVMLMRFLGIALLISGGSNLLNHFMLERADSKKKDALTVDFEVHKRD